MEEEQKHSFSSGATSSEHCEAYHLIPTMLLELTAKRYSMGFAKHGDVNYQKCIKKSTDGKVYVLDLMFARDRYNHGFKHLINLKKTGSNKDDNIGAVSWFCGFAAWVEGHGFDWQRILNPLLVNEVELAILTTDSSYCWVKTKDVKTGETKVHHGTSKSTRRLKQPSLFHQL